ncbi:fumarate reductase/succinate dehydrogenase flavoprotein domain protein [Alkaliphilus metalliredigens QYMF]|uniref:Fumarate reductase/succinate dehydrogenase flavoprotein domain protein n=2 Tax=Alkaliphilus TaxID=114627 RepID=A6TTV5_ALKMQ|nr:fumarate reductase/succinate dehydrogenase flavoprotein domain protein [Alkaliphilus metalliredigens QYMF]
MKLDINRMETDVLIIGGGTAGCFSALTISESSNLKVIITDKANIKRSGCLAAGVNAINAYIGKGETAESFVDYVKRDAEGIIREDLVYSIAKGLNQVTKRLEDLGIPILKDENGEYVQRGKRSIKINGENIKPILAGAVTDKDNIAILNNVNIVDYLVKEDCVIGAIGFSLKENKIYEIYAKKILCATGGASGLYKPNNPIFSRHKMWYSPFNTGAGYAMGIRAGAEMTSFEMRFIALRCKDTIAPTGTIAQGIKTVQINGKGEAYVERYGKPTTHMRLYSTVMENLKGNGPCFLRTEGITDEQQKEFFKAYLNMAPAQTLKWLEGNTGPSHENVEIEGTEPYIVGGHTASGYWVDCHRRTTLKNLYAVGDVAGGSPKKYVSGCLVEGEIAAMSIINTIEDGTIPKLDNEAINEKIQYISYFFDTPSSRHSIQEIEIAMQKIMDEYAGGISKAYMYNKVKLDIAAKGIDELLSLIDKVKANDLYDLLSIFEIIDRLYVCKVLIKHLEARKETRWRCYQENTDFPEKDDENWMKYINSVYRDGDVNILFRQLVGRDKFYEHTN